MEKQNALPLQETPEAELPCGILDQKEWKKLQEFQNRPHAEELNKEQVQNILMNSELVHPYKRLIVPVDSDAFRWAVKLVTGHIVKAKNRKRGVIQFECCNFIWIGVKPRQCVHSVNPKLKNQLDVRAQAMSRYKPDFIPINLTQYISAGGSAERIEHKVVEHVLEDKDDEVSVATQDWTVNEDSDEEAEQNGEYLG